ncbi:MAG: hypothetical protein JW731_15695, partial [Bacteroidales bacterium]|nr:hypothetical protein [Bacteroidales bacterium]
MKSIRSIRKNQIVSGSLLFLAGVILYSCVNQVAEEKKEDKRPVSKVVHPDWSKNSNIYEVNIRQYTPEG